MQFRKRSISLIFTIVFSTMFATQAFAYVIYESGARWTGGVNSRQYTIPTNAMYNYNGRIVDYGLIIGAATQSWNDKVNAGCCFWSDKTDVHLTETTDYSISDVDWYVYDFGDIGWRGSTEFFVLGSGNASMGIDSDGEEQPTENYDWTKNRLNVWAIHSSTTGIRSTVAHEYGHTFGLQHNNNYSGSVMSPYTTSRPTDPTSDDESGVRAIY
jgi:hypothetical protein